MILVVLCNIVGIKLILDVALFCRHGIDPAAVFLHGFADKHDRSDTMFSSTSSAIGLPSCDLD